MNEHPVKLKAADSPAPPDPQTTAIELMAALRTLADDTLHLRALMTTWGDNPVAVRRRAQSRAVEIAEQAARALDAGEQLVQAVRAARLFSVAYEDVGVQHGR